MFRSRLHIPYVILRGQRSKSFSNQGDLHAVAKPNQFCLFCRIYELTHFRQRVLPKVEGQTLKMLHRKGCLLATG